MLPEHRDHNDSLKSYKEKNQTGTFRDYPEGNEAWQENTLFLSVLCFM